MVRLLSSILQSNLANVVCFRLLPNWKEMVDRELAGRDKVRRLTPEIVEELDHTELEEEEYQCATCHMLCFLSQVVSVGGAIACLDHHSALPEGQTKKLRLRFSDDELRMMLSKVKARSDKAGRVPDLLLGSADVLDARTTGRKRKPSALALAAAGEDLPPAAQKVRHDSVSVGSAHDEVEDEPMPIEQAHGTLSLEVLCDLAFELAPVPPSADTRSSYSNSALPPPIPQPNHFAPASHVLERPTTFPPAGDIVVPSYPDDIPVPSYLPDMDGDTSADDVAGLLVRSRGPAYWP